MKVSPGAGSLATCLACLSALMISACAFAPWQKDGVPGDTPEERVANAQAARGKKPEDMPTRRDVHVTHERAIYELLQEADKALREGRITEAEAFLCTRALGGTCQCTCAGRSAHDSERT